MSGNRMTALIIVALIHLVVGYALVTGLAYEGVREIVKKVTTVDIKKDEEKKPPPPPPKPKDLPPPPIVAPPPKVNLAPPPVVETVQAPPPAPPPPIVLAPPPAPAPSQARGASLKNGKDIARFTQDYYPPDALRAEKQGRVGVRVTVGPDGRVSACTVIASSGTASLDDGACKLITKFGKFNPALDEGGNPTTGSISTGITYKFEG
jgi:protein TonB